MNVAIQEAYKDGLLGNDACGSGYAFDVFVHRLVNWLNYFLLFSNQIVSILNQEVFPISVTVFQFSRIF